MAEVGTPNDTVDHTAPIKKSCGAGWKQMIWTISSMKTVRWNISYQHHIARDLLLVSGPHVCPHPLVGDDFRHFVRNIADEHHPSCRVSTDLTRVDYSLINCYFMNVLATGEAS